MPELPEVETIRQGLVKYLPGKIIEEVEVRAPRIFSGDPEKLKGKKIENVKRNGKLLSLPLSEDFVLTIHLKMTGQLIFRPNSEYETEVMGGHPEEAYLQELPHKHTHVIINFTDGATLFYNDIRKFGRLTLINNTELSELKFLKKLGPEPLEENFTSSYLAEQLKKRPKQVVKTFLLDQENIAGLGNIYADESLFRAGIRPERLNASLSKGEIRNLFDAIQETLELAIMHGGSSARDYVNAVGEKGTFLKIANVYQRTNLGCSRCQEGIITRVKIGGRSSHYCPICQR